MVHAGDFVFADFDGVVVVPAAIVKQVIDLAMDKVRRENDSRAELMQEPSCATCSRNIKYCKQDAENDFSFVGQAILPAAAFQAALACGAGRCPAQMEARKIFPASRQ